MFIPTAALRNKYGWQVQELHRSPVMLDVTSLETCLHKGGKHPLAGLGGHPWRKDGGSPQQQDDSKMFFVGIIYNAGGWLSAGGALTEPADGALLMQSPYLEAYFVWHTPDIPRSIGVSARPSHTSTIILCVVIASMSTQSSLLF
jgi:hypothetical protein